MSNDENDTEEVPLVRSLSMSRNMAFSVVDEVSHMIRLPPEVESRVNKRSSWWKTSSPSSSRAAAGIRKSASTSSLQSINHFRNAEESNVSKSRRGSDQLMDSSRSASLLQTMSNDNVNNINNINKSKPLSRSQLPPIVKGTRRNDLLVGIVVSRWDNIVGPQSVYLWTEEFTSVFYPVNLPLPLSKLVKYVTDHTVDHQTTTGRCIHPSVQRTTLCIVPDLNLAYLSLSIRVPNDLDAILEFQTSAPMTSNSPDHPALTMPHSISVLYNLKCFDQFLLIRPVIVNWLSEFGPQIGVLLCKGTLQGSMINSWCAELCKTITAIQTCWAQDVTEIENSSSLSKMTSTVSEESQIMTTYSSTDSSNNNNNNNYNSKSYKTFSNGYDVEYLTPNNMLVPKVSLGSILTSHLTSFGSSIVAGHDSLLVNQIIRFLLCFSSAEEAYCSRYSLATLPDTFMKGLYVQGLILGGIGEKSISYKQVVTNRLPLTKIELGSKIKVKQTSVTTHTQEKETVIMQELQRLWTSAVVAVQSAESFPNILKDVAGFISQFLNEIEILPPELRYGRLLLFKRSLHAKAISLITFLHSIQHRPVKEKTKLQQLIPQILRLDSAEYLIVQVTAEKIRPGVMTLLHFE